VTVFTQAPDGALQDVEVFARSACIDERRQQHGPPKAGLNRIARAAGEKEAI